MKKFDAIKQKIKGPAFSILTPFLPDEEIDFASLEKNIEQIHRAGGKIFFVMGYNSRFSELSWEEIKTLNAFVAKKVKSLDKNHVVIVADPLHCSTKVSIEFARHAESIGADIISLICREKFYSEEQIHKHFKMVSDASNIGILIHEMPFLNGYGGPPVNYSISLLDRIADIPNVIAIKEDAKNDDLSRDIVAAIKDRVGIIISGGGKRQWLQFADQGCQAWLNGIGVFEPRLAVKFWEYHQKGDLKKRDEIVNEIEVPFFEKGLKKFGWHLVIKAAMQHRGLLNRKERMPLMELNEAQYKEVQKLMDSMPIDRLIQ